METNLFDELENFGKADAPKEQQQTSVSKKTSQPIAMDKLLKEASEYDKQSVKEASSKRSKDIGDFNEGMLEEPKKMAANKVSKAESEPQEPLGYIHNTHGKPQVVHDDPYLEPHMNDLYLRQNEFKK